MNRDGAFLSVTWDRLVVVCRKCVYSVSYLRQIDCCLQGVCVLCVTWGRLTGVYNGVLRQSLVINWWVSFGGVLRQSIQAGWQLSVSYMWQVGGYLPATWGRIAVICQLHEAGERLSVSYMRQDSVCLSVKWGRTSVFCRECVYSVCNLKRDGGCLSVTWGWLAVAYRGV